MKVSLATLGDKYDQKVLQSWKLDLEKAFIQLDSITIAPQKAFTPTLQGTTAAGSPTYVHQNGEWSLIGQRLFFNFYLGISAIGGMTGNVRIAGLPLPARNVANMYHAFSGRWSGISLPANYTAVVAQLAPGNKFLDMNIAGSAGVNAGPLAVSALSASCDFILSGSYAV